MIQKVVDIVPAVGTSSIEVLTENPTRHYALLVNISANVIDLMLGHVAVAGRGIRLNTGDNYEINLSNPWYGSLHAIASASPSDLTIVEVSRAT